MNDLFLGYKNLKVIKLKNKDTNFKMIARFVRLFSFCEKNNSCAKL